jgi:hypothetical protein
MPSTTPCRMRTRPRSLRSPTRRARYELDDRQLSDGPSGVTPKLIAGSAAGDAKRFVPIVATKSIADFNCDTSNATKPEGMRTSRRKIDYSTARVWTTIVYPDDDKLAVADVCYPNLCSERESSMCGG